jgi:translation elongation factor EF-Tu-like GTPase
VNLAGGVVGALVRGTGRAAVNIGSCVTNPKEINSLAAIGKEDAGTHYGEGERRLTTKAQRRRPRGAAMATATARRRSLQRMVRWHLEIRVWSPTKDKRKQRPEIRLLALQLPVKT